MNQMLAKGGASLVPPRTVPVIQVETVSFAYEEDQVLKDVSFTIHQGEFIGIVGENGSGKSTLMRLMLGQLPLQGGRIRVLGQDVQSFQHWHDIGYISQRAASQAAGFPATVEEVVGINLYSQTSRSPFLGLRHRKMIDQALQSVGMLDYKKRLIGKLSGGQQQRTLVARALVSRPKILFLDEPLAGVDKQSEDALYALLDGFYQRGMTLVMVAHDIPTLKRHATRLIELS